MKIRWGWKQPAPVYLLLLLVNCHWREKGFYVSSDGELITFLILQSHSFQSHDSHWKGKNTRLKDGEIAAKQLLSLGQASLPHSQDRMKPKTQIVLPA